MPSHDRRPRLSRRSLLRGGAALLGAGLLPDIAAGAPREYRLRAAPTSVNLLPGSDAQTAVWAYEGSVPGPVLRFRQGERARTTSRSSRASAQSSARAGGSYRSRP